MTNLLTLFIWITLSYMDLLFYFQICIEPPSVRISYYKKKKIILTYGIIIYLILFFPICCRTFFIRFSYKLYILMLFSYQFIYLPVLLVYCIFLNIPTKYIISNSKHCKVYIIVNTHIMGE